MENNTVHSEQSLSTGIVQAGVVDKVVSKVRASRHKYASFEDAKSFAHSLNIKSRKEWREYVKGKHPQITAKPDHVPAHPDGIYKTRGWQGWRNWLGTEKPKKEEMN